MRNVVHERTAFLIMTFSKLIYLKPKANKCRRLYSDVESNGLKIALYYHDSRLLLNRIFYDIKRIQYRADFCHTIINIAFILTSFRPHVTYLTIERQY